MSRRVTISDPLTHPKRSTNLLFFLVLNTVSLFPNFLYEDVNSDKSAELLFIHRKYLAQAIPQEPLDPLKQVQAFDDEIIQKCLSDDKRSGGSALPSSRAYEQT